MSCARALIVVIVREDGPRYSRAAARENPERERFFVLLAVLLRSSGRKPPTVDDVREAEP